MKVTFYQSSAVMIEMNGIKILNDPWLVDGELYGAWNHYPRIKLQAGDFTDVDYIYLSHIHQDHFSKKTLSELDKKIPVYNTITTHFIKVSLNPLCYKGL